MNDRYTKEEFMKLLSNVNPDNLNYRTLKMYNTLKWLIVEVNRLEAELLLKEDLNDNR